MRKWNLLPLVCLLALLCVTQAAADFQPVPLNCHEMSELLFSARDTAGLLDAGDSPEEAALAGYFTAREAAYRGEARLLSGDDWETSPPVADNNTLRAERVREMETRLGLNVLDADVTARIDRARTVRNPDGTRTLYVYEWTYFDYDDLSDGAGGLDVSGFGTWHILTVARRPDGSCEILSDEYDESDVLGISTLSETRLRELAARGFAEADFGTSAVQVPDTDTASLMAFSYYSDYDVDKAVTYSETYWQNYNPAYANFNSVGGDCANFTSQSIAAGGMPQAVTNPYGTNGWYYKTSTDRSATWTTSTNMRQWMSENRGRLVNLVTASKTVTPAKTAVYAGSPVFYSTKGNGTFQHTVLCVGTNSAGTPIVNSHNNDRHHVIWNYYTGSVQIDTVQLTSAAFGTFSGYVKLGADFHAYVLNPSLNRYVTNDGGGQVTARARTQESGQVWHFTRQDDGSYAIVSALRDTFRNPALAVSGSGWAAETPVRTEPYDASPGQNWYIYWDGGTFAWGKGAYQLRPKCSDCVLENIVESAENEDEPAPEGTEFQISARNKENAQLFQLQETEWIAIDTPVLKVTAEGSEGANVKFSWESLTGAETYILRVTQGTTQFPAVALKGRTSYGMKLDPGDYQATLEAVSANERTSSISDPVPFTVYTSYTITYLANGGSNAPEEQMKIEQVATNLTEIRPVYPGYVFTSWNTDAKGTGTSYESGSVYDKDEDLTLYAQWELAEYTVALDPNHGTLAEETITVTYSKEYGALPTPIREGYDFSGWFTELDGGHEITEKTIVSLTENHTLYAHWDSNIPYISSVVTRMDTFYMVRTTFYRISSGTLFVCGYLNGQLMEVVSADVRQSDGLTLEGDFDTIRVMALENGTNLPLCPCNVILERQFR